MKKFTFFLAIIFAAANIMAQAPDNWTGDSDIELFQESTTVHGGSYSCGVIVNSGTQGNCDLSNDVLITVSEGDDYKITFWANTSDHVRITGVLDWEGTSSTYTNTYVGPATAGWEQFVYEGTVPAGATGVNLRLRFYDVSGFAAPETQYVDDVEFESPIGEPVIVANGDFETWPGLDPEPSNHPTNFTAEANGANIALSWTDATGTQLPAAYLIKASNQDNITPPVDGTYVPDDLDLSDGSGAANVAYGEESFSFTSLPASTTFYFKIYPYTNSGTNVDYKTDGTVPSANATTETIVVLNEEDFDDGWGDWTTINVLGDQVWTRDNDYGIGGTPCAQVSGYEGGNFANEDWLISPAMDFDTYENELLTFWTAMGYPIAEPQLSVKISTDYDGGGDPSTAVWTDLDATLASGDPYWEWTYSGEVDVSGYAGNAVYVAFVYLSDGSDSETWEVDDISITAEGTVPQVATPVFDPLPGNYSSPVDVTITSATPDATIYYTTDGTDPTQASNEYTAPVNISETTTLKARAYADGMDPSLIASGDYLFPTTVATIAELRAGTLGQEYILSGEVVLTYQQSWRNQKFVQDGTAAILIDDYDGVITSDYEIGDGITGLKGTLDTYGNMIQIIPSEDPGDPTSAGNTIDPEIVTIAELFGNFEEYESELVKIEAATFANPGVNFQEGTVYEIIDDSEATGDFRTSFYDADYLYTPIPAGELDLTGIPNSRFDGDYFTSRFSDDIVPLVQVPTIIVTSPDGYEMWQQGTSHNITWQNIEFSGNVTIELLKGPFGTSTTLAEDIVNTGSWEWNIPSDQTPGDDYKVRVSGVGIDDPTDVSNEYFSIIETIPVPDIVINEIMYNPSSELGSDFDYEYLELYNNSGFGVDLGNWYFGGIDFIFPAGTTLGNDQYLVLAINADSIAEHYGITNVMQWTGGNLGNSGETVELFASDGTLMDVVTYDEGGSWPEEPDGNGPSLELLDPDFDNSLPESWAASIVNDGTPGAANSVIGAEILTVNSPNGGETFEQGSSQEITWDYVGFAGLIKIELITAAKGREVLAENIPVTDGLWDWEVPADQTTGNNFKIRISDMDDGDPMDESDGVFSIVEQIIPAITVVSPNGGETWAQGTTHDITWTYEFFTGDIKIELSDGAKTITLIEDSIPVANTSFAWTIPADQAAGSNYTIIISGMEAGDPSDESDAPFSIIEPVPAAEIVINEIMYNPSDELGNDDTYEYLELYNNDTETVDLMGWTFAEGIDFTFTETYLLNAGEYVVVAIDPAAITAHYGIANVVGPFGGGLSNGGEDVILTNASGQVADMVEYNDGGAWPSEPDGDGPSLELINPSLDNSLPENWAASTVINGTPGIINSVYQGGEVLTVVSPNGGESWEQGSSQEITWSVTGFTGNIKIELLTAKGREVLADNIPVNDLLWDWEIPADQTPGDNYLIQISDTDDGDPMDQSDGVFSIIEPVALPDIVINEIMYNSPGTDNEWIEIYNNETFTVDLEGYYFIDDDDAHTPVVFPTGYSIAPGQYFTVSLEVGNPPLPFVPDFEGNASWSLNNGGDEIRMFHPSGQLVDNVAYLDVAPWPTAPDGDGPTLSLLLPSLDNSLPESWAASLQDGGTPGSENFPVEPTITVISPNGGESVQQGSTFTIDWSWANFDGFVKIELLTQERAVASVIADNIPVTDGSYEWLVNEVVGDGYIIKISDTEDGDPMDESDAPFSIVPAAELPDVVINEIMYNPPESGTDSLEYIELYNNSDVAVNLNGWYFLEGIDYIFPDYELAAGDFVVVAVNADAMFNTFGVTALQCTSGGLSNSGEDIDLRNASDEQIDIVDYSDGGAWTSAPDGYGPSLALLDPSLDNSLPENWMAETELTVLNAEDMPIYASPGAANFLAPAQGILVSEGWTGISSYAQPADPSVDPLLDLILNDLVVMQDFNMLFFPAYNINTIGNWDNEKGYQIKMNNERYHVIYGPMVADKTVDLITGWNSLPVLSDCAVEAAALFGSLGEVVFVKEMGSDKIYWPDGSIFTLDYLMPGNAYFIKVSADVSITFPECAAKTNVQVDQVSNQPETAWNAVNSTGASHAIGFATSAFENLQKGDIIAAITSEGYCSGLVEAGDQNAAMMVWGDDAYTGMKDGFAEEEIITLKVYRPSTGQTFDAIPEYDPAFDNEGLFANHGISYVTGLKLGSLGIDDPEHSGISIYPNPAQNMLHIDLNAGLFDQVEIYSAIGQKVFDNRIFTSRISVDISNLDNGYYFIKFVNSSKGNTKTERFVKK